MVGLFHWWVAHHKLVETCQIESIYMTASEFVGVVHFKEIIFTLVVSLVWWFVTSDFDFCGL